MAYAYEWNDSTRVSANPALEPHFRAASIAAATWLEDHPDADPHFTGGQFASAANESAKALAIVIAESLVKLTPLDLMMLLHVTTFAARGGLLVKAHGFGASGWAALADSLPPQPKPRAARPR